MEEFDDEKDTETLEEDEDTAYAAVDEAAPSSPGSPPAKRPVNPFSKGGSSVIASPPRKRKNVFDLLKGMQVCIWIMLFLSLKDAMQLIRSYSFLMLFS